MAKQEKHQCEAKVYGDRGWGSHQCTRNGKVQRDGKWYCNQHDPIAVEEKRVERDAKWKAEYIESARKMEESAKREARRDACEEASEELIAALKQCVWIMSHTGGMQDTVDRAKNAIAKATE